MNIIRPVSDLRNNFADISKTVHETAQPVFLTKNGYGDMVVMSMETFEKMQFESDVYFTTDPSKTDSDKEIYSSIDSEILFGGHDPRFEMGYLLIKAK